MSGDAIGYTVLVCFVGGDYGRGRAVAAGRPH
jgi:hypothetical protein